MNTQEPNLYLQINPKIVFNDWSRTKLAVIVDNDKELFGGSLDEFLDLIRDGDLDDAILMLARCDRAYLKRLSENKIVFDDWSRTQLAVIVDNDKELFGGNLDEFLDLIRDGDIDEAILMLAKCDRAYLKRLSENNPKER